MIEILKNALTCANISVSDESVQKMADFYRILTDYNQKINLTRITSEEEAAIKHFADSLVAIPFIEENSKVCDVGSGGGFPAIPLAISTRADFTLVDATMKKVNYLNDAIGMLSLTNARAIQSRAEDIGAGNMRESFDIVTARAVASLPTLLEYCLPLVKVGGLFVAYKTSEEEISISEKALKILGGRVERVHTYSLGEFADSRSLILVRKCAPTPRSYPRGQNKPRIKPIG